MVIWNIEDFDLTVQVGSGTHECGAGNNSEGLILGDLQVVNGGFAGGRGGII